MIPQPLKKWLAFGSGVGIHVTGPKGSESLRISAVRVRPGEARALGGFTIEDFSHQPAAVWGTDYAAFLGKLGLRHLAATVLLPRHEVIVRPLALPGVADKDLEGAVRFQLDTLHPYDEQDVYFSWTRLPGTSTVLVAIARRDVVERYAALFTEAGIKIGAFTCSAAAVYSALRLFGSDPAKETLASDESGAAIELYGESAARPVFSASFELEPGRAAALASAELRFEGEVQAQPLAKLLSADPPLPYAAALCSACPRHTLAVNLLPAGRRHYSSPLRWIPSAALGAIVLLLAGALAAFPSFERRRFVAALDQQIALYTPLADRSTQLDREIATARSRMELLDNFRRNAKSEMDVLAELTKIMPGPPTWLNLTEISPRQVVLGGETDQAEPLLKLLDASPLFEGSEFQAPPVRLANGWLFRIRTTREGVKP